MNLSKSVLLVLIILICVSVPSVLSNFTVLKNLLSVFKSTSPAKGSPANETQSPNEATEINATNSISKSPESPTDQQVIADHLESANQRSALISEDDHKFSPAAVFKEGLFRGNLITQLKEMIKRRSVEDAEQSGIVNIEDVDEEKESEDEPNKEDGLIVVSNQHHAHPTNLAQEYDGEGDEEEYDDEDEDSFTGSVHKKSTEDEPSNSNETISSNDLKLPPRRKLIEQIFNELNKEMQVLAAIIKNSDNDTRQLEVESNKAKQAKEKAEQAMSQVLAIRGSVNETHLIAKFNQTVPVIMNVSLTSHSNQTDQHPFVKSFFKFDNSTNTTAYTYLNGTQLGAEQTANSDLLPAFAHSQLLGNTMESLEKILEKYTFLNLYPAPTINDTHNDRDLHQKEDDRVVLKANFADYPGYTNTEKSPILGKAPPVQNLTDITYGNVRVKGSISNEHPKDNLSHESGDNSIGVSSGNSSSAESDDKIEIIKN